jgi:hypothetical protein
MDHSSDKHFFHRYTEFYERCFARLGAVRNILEFGVLKGASIRWLAERFPEARIVGADLLPEQPEWPRHPRIEYKRVDQGHRSAITRMLSELDRSFELIIEDGSHIPEHQASCLVLGVQRLAPGGMYVLEDIHTSLPHHPYSAKHPRGTPNSLAVLLALQHLADTARPLTPEIARTLAHVKFFSTDEIMLLARELASYELFQRTALPLKCYACGSSSFRYAEYRCKCGTPIYFGAESMSFVVTRRSPTTS